MYILEGGVFFMQKIGSLEVICGSMFSGKSEELMRRIKRTHFANKKSIIFKPSIDNRYSADAVASHDGKNMRAVSITYAEEIEKYITYDVQVIGIDEVQFIAGDLESVIEKLIEHGKRVIVSGLDMDYLGHPFEKTMRLMATADRVTKLQAICTGCGESAVHSARFDKENKNRVVIGETDQYTPLCRTCYADFIKR